MSETGNPYQAPASNLVPEPSRGDWSLIEPRRVPASHGWTWIRDAFRLFAKSPGLWVLNLLIFMVLVIAISVIPFLGWIGVIPAAIMSGGLMLGAYQLDRGEAPLKVDHLFAGFQNRLWRLAAIGGLYLLATIVISFAVFVPMAVGIGFMAAGSPDAVTSNMVLPMVIAFGVMLLLFIPVGMAYWFAPALAMLHDDIDAIRAMKLSLVGCLRNILPLIVYGLILLLFMIVAMIPAFLGLLVLWPVAMISIYTAYRDIFIAPENRGA